MEDNASPQPITVKAANTVRLALASHDEGLLDVRHFAIHEGMNEPFEITVLAYSHDEDIELGSIVGRGAALEVRTGNDLATTSTRAWAGICTQMSQVHAEPPPGMSAYELTIMPALWRTTLRRNNRIYQHMTTPEIVRSLLTEWKIEPVLKISAKYKSHEYCVQYGETDYAFICRLLEDAGISFYFAFSAIPEDDDQDAKNKKRGDGYKSTSKLVLSDVPHQAERRKAALAYAGHQTPRFGGDRDFCATVRFTQRMKTGHYTLRDFDFRLRPDTGVFAQSKTGGQEDAHEHYAYRPGAFLWEPGQGGGTPVADDKGIARTDMPGEGAALVSRVARAGRQRRRVVSFHTNAMDLAPGSVVSINQDDDPKAHERNAPGTVKQHLPDHPRKDLGPDKKLLVIETSFEGEHNGDWSMTAGAVFADEAYRPERKTHRPKMYGLQSALVVGPAGQDIYTDEFGRVRVQFHWDRQGKYDDHTSCWMRVSQAWAGGGFGMNTIPRIGHEVLVDFFEGDPDQPIIVGRVYNATTAVPYKLPENMTQSGWKSDRSPGGGGYNEIRFEDKKGKEEIHLQAEKKLSYVVNNIQLQSIGAERIVKIGGQEPKPHGTDTLNVGDRHRTYVGSHQSIEVGETYSLSVGGQGGRPPVGIVMTSDGSILMSTGNAVFKLAQGNIWLNAEGEIHLHAGQGQVISTADEMLDIRGKTIRINDASSGEHPDVDKVTPRDTPVDAGHGLSSGVPFKPSGGGSFDKPGPIRAATFDPPSKKKAGPEPKKPEPAAPEHPPAKQRVKEALLFAIGEVGKKPAEWAEDAVDKAKEDIKGYTGVFGDAKKYADIAVDIATTKHEALKGRLVGAEKAAASAAAKDVLLGEDEGSQGSEPTGGKNE